MSCRRVRLDLAYDGTDFAGWQFQPGQRTVQGTLEEQLERLAGGRPSRVRGAGRTDAGAHAQAQVADLDYAGELDDQELERALTRMLPSDLRVLRVLTTTADFDARRQALAKTYCYWLDRSRAGDPFQARFRCHHPHPLNLERMRDALGRLPGRRDWSGFTASGCEVQNRVRDLRVAELETLADQARFTFVANGFLTHMVRILVGTLLEIGRGRFQPSRIDEILSSGDRRLGGPTAPARGLCLVAIEYPEGLPDAGLRAEV